MSNALLETVSGLPQAIGAKSWFDLYVDINNQKIMAKNAASINTVNELNAQVNLMRLQNDQLQAKKTGTAAAALGGLGNLDGKKIAMIAVGAFLVYTFLIK